MAEHEPTTPPDLTLIVGQDRAVAWLQRGLLRGQLHHGLLFAGPEGVGRQTTARALAATLLCHQPAGQGGAGPTDGSPSAGEGLRPCGACQACRLVAAGSHPDLHPVYKELARYHDDPAVRNRVMQDLGIGVIRQFLLAPAASAATMQRGKVFIVRDAELMSVAAQNALLKTLEEPPPGVTIVLLTQRAEQLLPTTRSRCALLRFLLLGREFVVARLTAAGVDSQQARFWSAFTDGSLGRAQRLAEGGLYELKCEIVDRIGRLDPAGDTELGEYLAAESEKLAKAAVKAAKAADGSELSMRLATRQALAVMLQILSSLMRDAMDAATGCPREPVHADQVDAVAAVADRLGAERLAEAIEQLAEYERLLWRNANAKVIWDNVVITCASAAPLRV